MATKKPLSIPLPVQEVEMVERIYDAIQKKKSRKFNLSRLGASGIGNDCVKRIWFSWRGYDNPQPSGRIFRLFETGNLQETRIVDDLRDAGYSVWDMLEDASQYTYTDKTGHFVVKLDGIVKGVPDAEDIPHVLEIKTHNTKSFADLEKKGLVESQPSHYFQIQAGMLFGEFERGLYVALNKDNEQYYIRRVKPDPEIHIEILERINTLIDADLAPAGAGEDYEKYPCAWCDYRDVCYKKKPPIVNCRSCEHSKPFENGTWLCTLKSATLTLKNQIDACDDYSQKGK